MRKGEREVSQDDEPIDRPRGWGGSELVPGRRTLTGCLAPRPSTREAGGDGAAQSVTDRSGAVLETSSYPGGELPPAVPWGLGEAFDSRAAAVAMKTESPPLRIGESVPSVGSSGHLVQMMGQHTTSDDHVHAAAISGTRDAASPLPHLDTIQAAFGDLDLSSVRAHLGSEAAAACAEMGVSAYATGNDVAFTRLPDLRIAAHETAHIVQQRGGVELKGGIGEAGDAYEREADAVADAVVMGNSVAIAGTPAQPAARGVVQCFLPRADEQEDDSFPKYQRAVAQVASVGLPVRLLQEVGRSVRISIRTTNDDHYKPWLNELVLGVNTMTDLAGMSNLDQVGGSAGIETLYHEATHAWFDLHARDLTVRRLMGLGEHHYENAPVRGGSTTSDPSRMLQEAAGMYVGHRAKTWWVAYDMLTAMRARNMLTPEQVARLRAEYNRGMAERVFGYSMEGGILGIGGEQKETSMPMASEVVTFLDRELLEGRIPHTFDEVQTFHQIIGG
jgi:hypothetical protein